MDHVELLRRRAPAPTVAAPAGVRRARARVGLAGDAAAVEVEPVRIGVRPAVVDEVALSRSLTAEVRAVGVLRMSGTDCDTAEAHERETGQSQKKGNEPGD